MPLETFNQKDLPLFSEIIPENIIEILKNQIDANQKEFNRLLTIKKPRWETFMQPMEEMSDDLNKIWSPLGHLHAVKESEAVRQAYNEGLEKLTIYNTTLSQNESLYKAISQLSQHETTRALNPAQLKIIENDIRDFKLAGIHLDAEKKAQLADLLIELNKQITLFAENLLDATHAYAKHITDANALAGLPEQSLQMAAETAKSRNLSGYVLTLDYPMFSSAIKFLHDRELRREIYTAYTTRASDQGPDANRWDNSQVMESILEKRYRIAKLVGFQNFAEYSLATKMAKNPDDVLRFLYDLLGKSKPLAKQEFAEVVATAKKDGIDEINAWDIAYYSEICRKNAYDFSPEDLRPYFPADRVLTGLFAIVQKLFGITIKEQKNIDVWHEDVRFFAVYNVDQQLCAGFYIDLYARAHKRDGAWMDDCRVRHRFTNGQLQLPVAYLTCNFMPASKDQPALLTHDDVVTLFHEFGHCLQHMLTQVELPSVAGINGIPWDAVEFPSQFMENFCWEKDALDLLAQHYQTKAPLPDLLYDKMMAAKHFQTGLNMLRQLEFALFDFKLYLQYNGQQPGFVQQILDEIRKETAITPIAPFNRFQHSFSHIFGGGYAAGYYSYKWAEVMSADAYAQFEENGIFDQHTGLSFMKNILEPGGVVEPMQAFIAFRGRKPTVDALLEQSGITSHPNV